ncbi:hypothetical protein SETIT_9G209700v2 [Setaria italica]|uniref:Uncharacterized protein n=1 Tax=Setaria italica TaxID=4555 RepID=A0A368SIU5_SETIT|nr:hypothetical protein SETIT_9G209700v2 [Setaria italica]
MALESNQPISIRQPSGERRGNKRTKREEPGGSHELKLHTSEGAPGEGEERRRRMAGKLEGCTDQEDRGNGRSRVLVLVTMSP